MYVTQPLLPLLSAEYRVSAAVAGATVSAVVFAIALGLTSGALAVLHGLDPRAPHTLELVVLVAATLGATVARYVALCSCVFRRDRRALSPPDQPNRASPA